MNDFLNNFTLRNGVLHAEDIALPSVAKRFGTPCYVYSRRAIEAAWRVFDDAFAGHDHLICYAVKANSNLAVLNLLARLGSGFDIVSGGELERVLAAGGDPAKVVFSGVAKTEAEMRRALEVGILCFNVESEPELERLAAVAQSLNRRARVSLRINPDVDPDTHPYIATGLSENKFGIDIHAVERVYRRAADLPGIDVTGVDFHIGSQLTRIEPITDALERVLALIDRLQGQGIEISHLDVGGGVAIRYRDETPPSIGTYARQLLARLESRPLRVLLEPGRAIVGNAGVLLTRVEYLKHTAQRHFAIVDAAMNDLLRPALYDAWMAIEAVVPREGDTPTRRYDVVGPVCESADFLARDRELALAAGDLLAVRSAGAYGFVMSSNYNSRPRPAELLADGEVIHLIRERECSDALWAGERLVMLGPER
ncbi:diaminopimelate decarboxylase [Nitrococcus mobilis Nb-231]|uniref:Diaminopimelate decarboxylase n=1 Tax=Nitrococcus mobilis Nb-231 TaxID=314278 RepID=A4BTZ6_9GAMM|nr:diaminopimelate decarboxylase [Nitrococcus mobilis]EAR20817.1 diaminopimelate decarboxylase [Nitrococcus mobilis Nb-231]